MNVFIKGTLARNIYHPQFFIPSPQHLCDGEEWWPSMCANALYNSMGGMETAE